MSAATAARCFVGLVAQPDTLQLRGSAAQTPLTAGQMIVGNGTYTDGSATGPGIFLVLRQLDATEYLLAPFGTTDGDWSQWLGDKSSEKTVLWRNAKDPIPEEKELLRRWQVISEKGEVPKKSDYVEYGKKIAEGIEKKWSFLNDLVVSERPPPQAATVPPFFGKR